MAHAGAPHPGRVPHLSLPGGGSRARRGVKTHAVCHDSFILFVSRSGAADLSAAAQGKGTAARAGRSSGASSPGGARCRSGGARRAPRRPYWKRSRSSPTRARGRMSGIHSMTKGVGSFWAGDVVPGGARVALEPPVRAGGVLYFYCVFQA